MYCLDTNILIDVLRGDRELAEKIEENMGLGVYFFITPITLCELYRGAYGHINYKRKLEEIKSLISNLQLLGFDGKSCEEFGRTYKALEKSGKLISEFDLIIASIVRTNDLILITRDKRHFENIGVKIEVW